MVCPDSDLKVLPMVVADWWLYDRWKLRLIFPQSRLVYRLNDHWNTYVGGNMVSSAFRDVRLGAAFHYQWSRTISAELETGYSVSLQIDYMRIDEKVKFDPAPYVRFSVNVGF